MATQKLPEVPIKKGEPAYKLWVFEPGWKGELPLITNPRKLAEEKRPALLPCHRLCAG